MISPGFFGFYNAHRSMLTAQTVLNTINQNISNANTPGYSRQRVEITAMDPYWAPNQYQLAGGQIGQGAIVDKVIRLRDEFVNTQYRNENSLLGLNDQASTILQQLEGILSEPSDQGINTALQNFFNSVEDLSTHPESTAVRSNFVQMATDLLTVFKQQANQLYNLRSNITGTPNASGTFSSSQMGIMVHDINTKLDEIAAINGQIITVKASGAEPNDLFDKRDQLLEDLSKMTDIQVDHFDNGQINVRLAGGNVMAVQASNVIEHLSYTMNAGPVPSQFDIPGLITTTSTGQVLNDFAGNDIQGGQLKALIDMGQFNAGNPTFVNVRSILGNLDTLFGTIANQLNTLQSTGRDLSGAINGLNFYTAGAPNPPGDPIQVLSWGVNAAFQNTITGPGLVAAAIDDPLATTPAGWAGAGDNRNAQAMANLRTTALGALGGATFIDYLNATTSNLGISSRTYSDRTGTQKTLLNSLDQQRQSISGVNTDEEMIDMLRFQRMFESSSKLINVFDEIYKTMINLTN